MLRSTGTLWVRDVGDVKVFRDVNVLKKTKDLMLITYLKPNLNSTYLWCFSPDPIFNWLGFKNPRYLDLSVKDYVSHPGNISK